MPANDIASKPAIVSRLIKFLLAVLFCSPTVATSLIAQDAPAKDEKEKAGKLEIPKASPGDEKLNQAIDSQFDADTPDELAKVIELCREAIKEGLEEDGEKLANQLIGSAAFDRAKIAMAALESSRLPAAAVQRLRIQIIDDLETATEADGELIEALITLARLRFAGGEREKAKEVLEKVIENDDFESDARSTAFAMRAALQEDKEKQLADLKSAVDLSPNNLRAWIARIQLLSQKEDFDTIYNELKPLIEQRPDNIFAIEQAVNALNQLDRKDDAIELLNNSIEQYSDKAKLFLLRADLLMKDEDYESALADTDRALELESESNEGLLLRAQINLSIDDIDAAKRDVDKSMALGPSVAGFYFRSIIAAQQERYEAAIRDVQQLVRNDPRNPLWLMQLGNLYQVSDSPRKAIEVADELIKISSENWEALRLRGDAKLAIGNHADAIVDYEKAIEVVDADDSKSGLLNNLAWLLATSPEDEIRDGKRSIELGTQACELTEYKEAHILSTLAAGYAETGDFENAVKWASKAVEVGKGQDSDQLEQLAEELESYKKNEPWRERQEIEENLRQIVPSTGGIDA